MKLFMKEEMEKKVLSHPISKLTLIIFSVDKNMGSRQSHKLFREKIIV